MKDYADQERKSAALLGALMILWIGGVFGVLAWIAL
jgi:hypothetical protein